MSQGNGLRTCIECQVAQPPAAFWRSQALCSECQRADRASVENHILFPIMTNPVPRVPGKCLIASCHASSRTDWDGRFAGEAVLCAGHRYGYTESPRSQDRCECGERLGTPYAQVRGRCYGCSGFTAAPVTFADFGEPAVTA